MNLDKYDINDAVYEMVQQQIKLDAKQIIKSHHECPECGESDDGKCVADGDRIICFRCYIADIEECYMDSCIR